MRLISFGPRGSELPGALVHDSVLPLERVLADIGLARTDSLRRVLPFLDRLGEGIDVALQRGDELIPVAQTRLGPPIVDPPNLFSVGANYFAHLVEHGADPTKMPTLPVIFVKPGSALSGPTDPIVRPIECTQFDYEAELAIVIGKGGTTPLRKVAERSDRAGRADRHTSRLEAGRLRGRARGRDRQGRQENRRGQRLGTHRGLHDRE
jgi:hypothetical protein